MQQTTEGGVMTGVFKSAEREKLFIYSDPLVKDDIVHRPRPQRAGR